MTASTADFFDEHFATSPYMAIFRGLDIEQTVERARAAWRTGVDLVEVPISSPAGWDAASAVLDASEGRPVGVGTVLTPHQVEQAAERGFSFTVSPGFDPAVSERCAALNLPHLPGVATATEVGAALAAGHQWQKAFPASVLGADWVRAILGPFPGVSFVCTGGMTRQSWAPFHAAGARAIAIGQGFDTV